MNTSIRGLLVLLKPGYERIKLKLSTITIQVIAREEQIKNFQELMIDSSS